MRKGKNKLLLILSLFCAVLVTSCDDDDENQDELTTQEFMIKAANNDMFEIQTGKKALVKGNIAEVRDFGQMLITDHTKTSNELKTLAQQKSVALPDSITEDKRVIRNRLAGETGKAFDQDFANVQITAHDEAVLLFQQAINEVDDADVRAFATRNLPALQMHRQHAQQVKAKADAQ